ncbi:MAG TPA: hypothetical protein VGB96_17260 [Archangium sp.]
MVIALVAGGVSFLGYRWRVRRRHRDAIWRELCLRLELAPVPGDVRVVSGDLQGIGLSLRDTGFRWLLELPLAQPLLPPGVVLLPAKAWRLGALSRLRPLRWSPPPAAPSPFTWYAGRDMPRGKVDASEAFLAEAGRAMEAHAPLEVLPHRLIHTLRAGPQLSVGDVREAVRALDATARRWLGTVAANGLPRVEALPRAPPLRSRLPRVRIPLKPVLSVLGVLALLFSCCFPVLALVRGEMKTEHTGQVVDIQWERRVLQMRCPEPLRLVEGRGEGKPVCPQQRKLVDYVKAFGGQGEPPRWPEPPSVLPEDALEREEEYTLHIEYGDVAKKVVTYELRSEELYRLFSKPGQRVSFKLERGRVKGLRPE